MLQTAIKLKMIVNSVPGIDYYKTRHRDITCWRNKRRSCCCDSRSYCKPL